MAYLFQQGLSDISKTLTGEENIYLGIRPYGFHAGNQLPFIAFPFLLAQKLKQLGKEPSFHFYCFINDWEQDGIEHYDVQAPFDVRPRRTTFQYTRAEAPNTGNIVDFWQPIIEKNMHFLETSFPKIKMSFIRNSTMKTNKWMKKVIIKTLQHPELIANTLRQLTGKPVSGEARYCLPVCPSCKTTKTSASVVKGKYIAMQCKNCGHQEQARYEDFDYWLYHKSLALPRIADHYFEGDFDTRRALFAAYGIDVDYPKTLYTPVLYGRDGHPMGKSKKNDEILPIEELLTLVGNATPHQKELNLL